MEDIHVEERSQLEVVLSSDGTRQNPLLQTPIVYEGEDATHAKHMLSPPPLASSSPIAIGSGSSSEPQRKRIQLDGLQKKFICELKRDNPKFTAADISAAFCDRYNRDLPRSTVSDILKRSDFWLQLESDTHEARVIRHRAVKFPAIEEALYEWYHQAKIQGNSLSDQILIERARAIRDEFSIKEGDFKVSNGWLQNFKRRHNIRPFASGVESESKALPVLIKESNCKPDDVFAFEDRGLLYRAPPLKSLSHLSESGKLKEKQKEYITVGLCFHGGGSSGIPPLVVAREPSLGCFGKTWTPSSTGIHYYSNATASLTPEVSLPLFLFFLSTSVSYLMLPFCSALRSSGTG